MTAITGPAELLGYYPAVLRLYARQMQLLDARELERYAATYTEDAEFSHPPHRISIRTRAGIIQDQIDAYRPFAGDRIQRRHMIGMIDLTDGDAARLESTAYCLVAQLHGERPLAFFSSIVRDVLIHRDGEFLVQSRRVEDD